MMFRRGRPGQIGTARATSAAVATRRPHVNSRNSAMRDDAAGAVATWHIGDVSVPIYRSASPERVPGAIAASESYLAANRPQVLAYLRWMAQKDLLGQDMCLCGPAGSVRRWLALQFCRLSKREAYFISISRDTTEADLKQRKEIRAGTLHYMNQAAVQAATEGQVLVIEGLERAERNVLPVLNNLLENREMHLDDGRMLVHPARFDELAGRLGVQQVLDMGLLRVSERFRVVALAVPAGQPGGSSLDPPLRSRFQCLYVQPGDASMAWAQAHAARAQTRPAAPGDGPTSQASIETIVKLFEAQRQLRLTSNAGGAVGGSSTALDIPPLGEVEVACLARAVALFPREPLANVVSRCVPWRLWAANGPASDAAAREKEALALMERCGVRDAGLQKSPYALSSIGAANASGAAQFTFECGLSVDAVVGPRLRSAAGATKPVIPASPTRFFSDFHHRVFGQLLQSHCCGRHMLIVGPAGCGKTAMVRELAALLGYDANGSETVHLYSDMTSRDLQQRRATNATSGDTVWELSGLLVAAKEGKLAVLDGVEQLTPGSLAVLHALLIDGSATLHDGSMFKSAAEYDALRARVIAEMPAPRSAANIAPVADPLCVGFTSEEAADDVLASRRVFRIHPAFRVIATARPPTTQHSKKFWLSPDIPSAFDVHLMTHMPDHDAATVVAAAAVASLASPAAFALGKGRGGRQGGSVMCPSEIQTLSQKLVALQRALETAALTTPNVPTLTLRQLLRIARYVALFPSELSGIVHEALLLSLATPLVADVVRATVQNVLQGVQAGGGGKTAAAPGPRVAQAAAAMMARIAGGALPTAPGAATGGEATGALTVADTEPAPGVRLRTLSVDGNVIMTVNPASISASAKALIPHVINYFDNDLHARVAAWIVKQLAMNAPILLVGNQGVGKNKVTDHVLATACLPRHYVQLHRDTTVASLTINPTVVDGRVVWEDSPLVKAATLGHVLIIDEIDKAPVEVVQIVKGLIEDRELRLADGRLITESPASSSDVRLHADFRVIVLANPPGFPFHGNDFYRECGDLFATYVLSNPDAASLLSLLRKYGPNVPVALILQLVSMFTALGEEWSAGRVQYPFSTRELIAVVKHLQSFPGDGVFQALNNVFHFDAVDEATMDTVRRLVHTHIVTRGAANMSFGGAAESSLESAAASADDVELHLEDRGTVPVQLAALEVLASSLIPAVTSESKRDVAGGARNLSLPVNFISVSTQPQASSKQSTVFDEVKASFDLRQVLERVADVAAEVRGATDSSVDAAAARVVGVRLLPNALLVLLVSVPLAGTEGSGAPVLALAALQNPAVSVGGASCPIPPGKVAVTVLDCTGLNEAPDAEIFSVGISTDVIVASPARNRFAFVNPVSGEATLARVPAGVLSAIVDAPLVANTAAVAHGCFTLSNPGSNRFAVWAGGQLRVVTLDRSNAFVLRHGTLREGAYHVVVGHGEDETGAEHFLLETPVVDPETRSVADDKAKLMQLLSADPAVLHGLELLPHAPPSGRRPDASVGEAALLRDAVAMNRRQNALLTVGNGAAAVGAKTNARRLVFAPAAMDLNQSRFDPASRQLTIGSGNGVTALDLARGKTRTLSSLGPVSTNPLQHDVAADSGSGVSLQPDGRGGKVYDALAERLRATYDSWRHATDPKFGGQLGAPPTPKELDMWYSEPRKQPSGELKHGKEDNMPHHGGNTYAGGTGGTDTAGLGGLIGPYRLDKGWDIHQVDPERKKQIPQHLVEEAKRMGKEALAKRLAEIGMSAPQYDTYMRYFDSVKAPVHQLRLILQGLKSKDEERVWLRHQTEGLWDDAKLVEGITGDKNVYKRRVDPNDDANRDISTSNARGKKKKRLLFLFDVSASMYRFNRHDSRLDRLLECSVLITEALAGYSDTLEYSIVGHSGDSPAIPLVPWGKPPADRMQRYQLCATMAAHAQHCWSGDHTLDAMRMGIKEVLSAEAEDYFVFLISDANLAQYGYSSRDFTQLIVAEPRVRTYCIFIASFGAQAQHLQRQLPAGRGFECMDTRELPQVLKRIFVAANILNRQ